MRGPGLLARQAQQANRAWIGGLLGDFTAEQVANALQYAQDVASGDVARRGIVWGGVPIGGGLEGYQQAAAAAMSGDRQALSGLLGDMLPGGGLLGTMVGKGAARPVFDVPYTVGPWSRKPAGAELDTFEMLVNPTESALRRLLAKEKKLNPSNFENAARLLEGPDGNTYAWYAGNATHPDIADFLGIPRLDRIGDIWTPD